jgi:cobalt-zinc-cadmium efflux system outer membrane protein
MLARADHERSKPLLALGASVLLALPACLGVEEPEIAPAWSGPDAARPLSHEDCVRLALESAPTAAAWKARLLAARAALAQAGAFPNPTLDFTWEGIGLVGHTELHEQETLTLAFALDEIAARKRKRNAAAFDLEAEEAALAVERLQLAAEVRSSYDELVAARARAALEGELEELAEEDRAAVQEFAASGLVPRIDAERAEAELAAAEASRSSALAAARARELAFAFALGFERPVHLELAEPLTFVEAADPEALESSLERAVENRPELAAASARYHAELERAKLEASRVKFLPTISGGPREEGDEASAVAGISVVLPIFDTGDAAVAAQNAELLASAAAMRRAAHDVAAEVCRAHDGLLAAREALEVHARGLAARRSALREGTKRLFEAGEADYKDLVLARRDEVEARVSVLEAELAAALARVALDAAVGKDARASADEEKSAEKQP